MGRRVAITPLKLNSQRLPGKNFKSLLGRPLYQWSLDTMIQLRNEGVLDEVAVYGAPAIKERLPADVVLYPERDVPAGQDGNTLFRKMMMRLPADVEWCCIWNVTSPFIYSESIRMAMRTVLDVDYDSAVSMRGVQGRLWDAEGHTFNHDPATCPRTQSQKMVYLESEAFWVLEPTLLIDHSRRVGYRPYFQLLDDVELVDIDTADDWRFAERIGASLCQKP